MAGSMGVRVRPEDAEKARKLLKEQEALDSRKAMHDHGVLFPVNKRDFDLPGVDYELVEAEFQPFKAADGFEQFLRSLGASVSSYDVIGDIAILEIPEVIKKQESDLAEELLKSKKHIKSVFKKSSAISGEERVRAFQWLAGENRTETVHREHGCEFKLDIARVFFSPRLSFERQRIMEQVKDGEMIVDMFAGVGPYSIVIAKHRDVRVLGCDINRDAIRYFEENIRVNRMGDRVRAMLGDCRTLAPKAKAGRCIMNLPKKGREFFESALDLIKPGGGVIHYYGVAQRQNPFEEENEFLLEIAAAKDRGIKILGQRVVRSYSPGEVHVAIDVGVVP